MSKFHIKLNYSGVNRGLLKSKEMTDYCKRKAQEIANRSGKGYEADFHTGIHRINASVGTATEEAMLDNSENNTLLKNVR